MHADRLPSQPTGTSRAILVAELGAAVDRLIAAAGAIGEPELPVSGRWNARDVVAHIVFWHESFARNVADLVAGRRPVPLSGTYAQLADRMAAELGAVPVDGLAERLLAAQASIGRDIHEPSLVLIPYRRGSRPYGPEEHLAVVRDHVRAHAADLERAAARSRATSRAGEPG